MALDIKTRYGARANDPSIDYPTGSIKNKSAPDATDGTPLEKDWANDWLGARDAILKDASISANGNVETAEDSQVLLAIKQIALNVANSLPNSAGNYSANSVFTSNQTFTSSDIGKSIAINSASATSHILPPANSFANGKAVSFSNINTGIASFSRSGSDNITGGNLNSASSISINNGETITLVSDGTSKWYVASSNVVFFGAPRTRQVVTRTPGTTYTNSTGRTIELTVIFTQLGGTSSLTVGGIVVANNIGAGFSANAVTPVTVSIQNNETYVINHTASNTSTATELR